jgi:uncharacterized protein (TIGR02145 family)
MKRVFLLLLLGCNISFSQSSGITYQAVIYNPNGEELPGIDNPYAPLVNQDICLQFGIVDADGNLEYQEQVQVTTDPFGMVNLLIGTNAQTGGYASGFAGVQWTADAKFLVVDLDIKGTCTDFEELSNQPFTYVPFAYYSPASDVPGPEGPQGPAGPAGAQGPQGEPGPSGADGQDGAVGATGPIGPQGPAGPQGPQGVAGPAGADGQDGAVGATGASGPAGPAGPQGIAGADGQDGNNGQSAYEIWLDLGNTGTEQDFIDSLVGPEGPQGAQGPQGNPGTTISNNGTGSIDKIASIGDYNWDIPGWEFDFFSGDGSNLVFVTNDKILYYPIRITRTTLYESIGYYRGASSNNASGINNINMRIGIFSFDNGLPGQIIYDLGLFDTPPLEYFSERNVSFSLNPGYYFVGLTSESLGSSTSTKLYNARRYANNSSVRAISPGGQIYSQNAISNKKSGNSYVFSKNSGQIGFSDINELDFIEMDYGGCILFKEVIIEQETFCDQNIWMTENLRVKNFRNGDPIPEVQDPSEWENLTTPAWCYYNGNSSNEDTYGILYNWYAVNDPRGIAPLGWHVATVEEITSLIDCLGGTNVAGGKMKTVGTIEDGNGTWLSPNLGATNESGWNGRGAGAIGLNSATPPQAIFFNLGNFESYWTSSTSETDPDLVYAFSLNSYTSNCGLGFQYGPIQGSPGFSVRCVKD